MSSRLIRGYCSACRQPAQQSANGHWWHDYNPCDNRGMWIFQPVEWWRDPNGRLHLGQQAARNLPAEFVPDMTAK